jgi:hypothetical protein
VLRRWRVGAAGSTGWAAVQRDCHTAFMNADPGRPAAEDFRRRPDPPEGQGQKAGLPLTLGR